MQIKISVIDFDGQQALGKSQFWKENWVYVEAKW